MARTLVRGNTQIMPGTITNAEIDATAGIELTKIEKGDYIAIADGTTQALADLRMGGFNITGLAAGVDPQDAVNKAQLDSVSAGLDAKDACHVATTAMIDLTTGGLLTIDGEVLTAGQRVLVKDQAGFTAIDATGIAAGSGYTAADVITVAGGTGTAATITVDTVDGTGGITGFTLTTGGDYSVAPTNPVSVTGGTGNDDATFFLDIFNYARQNGIYEASVGAWPRTSDFDGTPSNEVSGGSFSFVSNGTVNGGTGWIVVAEGDIVVDTDPIHWTQFSGSAEYTAGNGINIAGTVISAKVDGSTIVATGGGGSSLAVPTGGITTTQIANGTIQGGDIATDTITSTNIAENAVGTSEIAADAVTGDQIADNAVNSEHIAENAVTGSELAANAVDSVHITAGAVDGSHIANGAVDSVNIATGAIDGSHIADDAVDSEQIAAGAIDATHLSATFLDSIGPGLAGEGLSYNVGTDALDVNVDDVTIEIATDTLQVKAGGIDSAQIATGAVDGSHIANGAVDSVNIATGAIDGSHVAAGAIDETHIAASALGTGLTGGDGTVIAIDPSVVATHSGWTRHAAPAEPIATGTLTYTFNGGNPITANTFLLYLNGIYLEPGAGNDYTVNLTTGVVTFASVGDAPRTNDKLTADFVDVP